MSSKACCIGRHPPSPDGIAPRLAAAPLPNLELIAKSEEIIPASWSSGSRLSQPEDIIAIQAIFEEDKSSSYCNEYDIPLSKKPSSTLSAVKTRLKKHLSKDSGFSNSKRQSRASVGTSEEEIQRRAELRRIRHKRIQEELSQEDIYDDDAKSVDPVVAIAASGIPELQKGAPEAPGDLLLLPLSLLNQSDLSSSDAPNPGLPTPDSEPSNLDLPSRSIFNRRGPMLETLYCGLASAQIPKPEAQVDILFPEGSTSMINTASTYPRRHSSPGVLSQSKVEEPNLYQPPRKRSSIAQMPPAPVIQPQRLPSISLVDTGRSSWRLSFSADNRGDQLRKLSQGMATSTLLSPATLIGGPQPMRKWLHGQGLRATSQAIEFSEDASMEHSPPHSQTCLSSANFGGVDGSGVDRSGDFAKILHLHEMGISQHLASKGLQSSSSSPQLSTIASRTHHRGFSSISGTSRASYISRARRFQNTTDSLPLSERIPYSWGNIIGKPDLIQDGASSFYPSTDNSIQPSLKSSRLSLFSMLPGIKSKIGLEDANEEPSLSHYLPRKEPPTSPLLTPTGAYASLGQVSVPVASTSCDSLPLRLTASRRRQTIDANSTSISETESFRQRELELSFVRTRFAAAEASRSPGTPRSSRFREEFGFSPLPRRESLQTKHFAFSRLAKLAFRGFDGPFEKRPRISNHAVAPALEPDEPQKYHYSRKTKVPLSPFKSSLEDGTVPGMRSNDVQMHVAPEAKNVTNNVHIPGKKNGQAARQKSYSIKKSREQKKKFAMKGPGWSVGDESDSGSEKEKTAEDEWEAELAKVAQNAKESRDIAVKCTAPDKKYPASWSKFSSHDRHERTASAKARDRVQVKDFATDGSELLDHDEKTLKEKVRKRVIAELDKQATTEVQHSTQKTWGRRSSMRPSGELEYPELEVLPLYDVSMIGRGDIAEHIEQSLEEEGLDKKVTELDAISGQPVLGAAPKLSSDALAKKNLATERESVARSAADDPSKLKPRPKIASAMFIAVREKEGRVATSIMNKSTDHSSESSVVALVDSMIDDEDISVADPRFYDDCIVNTTPAPERGLSHRPTVPNSEIAKGSKNSRYRTWNGKDWDSLRHSAKIRRSLGTLKLQKSTSEMLDQLKQAEITERENTLKAAEAAWGS